MAAETTWPPGRPVSAGPPGRLGCRDGPFQHLTFVSPGAIGLVLAFMPTFPGLQGGGLDTLASAALAHVGDAISTAAVAAPRVSTGADVIDSSVLRDLPDFDMVPAKLIKRIWDLEFVDMAELLPETWRVEVLESGCCHTKRPRRELIVDFVL